MRPHVCLFTDSLEPSGVGRHMLLLARELRGALRLSLVCPPSAQGARLLADAAELGISVHAMAVRDGASEQPFVSWMAEQEVSLLHVHAGIGWEGHHGIYAAARAGIPVVRTEHLPYLLTDADQRQDHARVAALCARIICVSSGVRDTFAAAGVPRRRLSVVPNGIARPPAPTVAGEETRAALGLPEDARMVLTVGRFTPQKGYADLLAAVPEVIRREPRARFVWVGDGPLLQPMADAVRDGGLEHFVRLAGARSDVPELMAAAELLVLPSRFEGLPLVALEAMAAGLPVIGTDVCGTNEAVVDGVTGRLVPVGNPFQLAVAIANALADEESLARWGHAGRQRVRARFTARRMARRTLRLYQTVLAGVPAAA